MSEYVYSGGMIPIVANNGKFFTRMYYPAVSVQYLEAVSGILETSIEDKIQENVTWMLSYSGGADDKFVPVSGGTLSGALNLYEDPIVDMEAATKHYVDVNDQNYYTAASSSLFTASGILRTYIDSSISGVTSGELSTYSNLSGTLTNNLNLKADKTYVDTQDSVLSGLILDRVTYSNLTTASSVLSSSINGQQTYTNIQALNALTSGQNSLVSYSGYADNRFVPFSGGTLTNYLTLHTVPTSSGHAANKFYVDNLNSITSGVLSNYTDSRVLSTSGVLAAYTDSRVNAASGTLVTYTNNSITTYSGFADNKFVAKSGSTMTGFLTLDADPTLSGHAATKQYVDNRFTNLTTTTGSTTISGGNGITLVTDPNNNFTIDATGQIVYQNHGVPGESCVVTTFGLTTTTANTFTVLTIPMTDPSAMRITYDIIGRRTDGNLSVRYKSQSRAFYREGRNATGIGIVLTIIDIVTNVLDTTMVMSLGTSGGNVLVQVQSTITQPIRWTGEIKYQKVST